MNLPRSIETLMTDRFEPKFWTLPHNTLNRCGRSSNAPLPPSPLPCRQLLVRRRLPRNSAPMRL